MRISLGRSKTTPFGECDRTGDDGRLEESGVGAGVVIAEVSKGAIHPGCSN